MFLLRCDIVLARDLELRPDRSVKTNRLVLRPCLLLARARAKSSNKTTRTPFELDSVFLLHTVASVAFIRLESSLAKCSAISSSESLEPALIFNFRVGGDDLGILFQDDLDGATPFQNSPFGQAPTSFLSTQSPTIVGRKCLQFIALNPYPVLRSVRSFPVITRHSSRRLTRAFFIQSRFRTLRTRIRHTLPRKTT